MTQNQSNRKITIGNSIIILLSIIGLAACIAALFPQVRGMIMDFAAKIMHKEASTYQVWLRVLLSYAMGGICFILFFDYCTLTASGRSLVKKVRQEVKDCLSEIDFRLYLKPSLILAFVYLLGILTIIRANYSYNDDMGRVAVGYRGWYNWDRYVNEFISILVNTGTNIIDISPLPQLLAVVILTISSLILVYVIGKKKVTVVRLLASVPLGLSPFFLENIVYKVDAPYMSLSILTTIFPFLFIERKKAFVFISVVCLLIMCMTYQASSGIYMMIVAMICFQDWNSKEKTNKEILYFLGTSAFAFCLSMLLFRFFLMRPFYDYYTSNAVHPLPQLISGTLGNIKEYATIINHDLGMTWRIGIIIILLFFITKSMYSSAQGKILSFFVSILVIALSFILSFGVYSLLAIPLLAPRVMYGFGVFLAIVCIYVVSDYKKIAVVTVFALNWCFFVFIFSYGNALADQARYAEFRATILLNDLSGLYPNVDREGNLPEGKTLSIQLKNSIDFTPVVKNIAKHYPLIEKLVPKRLAESFCWDNYYYMEYFNYVQYGRAHFPGENSVDFSTLNLPVVLDSYYHTIQSDGEHVLVVLKH